MQTARRSLAVAVCALICSAVALLAVRPLDAGRADDRNRDGRPDVWRSFDRHGRVARIAVDTNFDGRSDVEEFFDGGTLVRRQSDRDFNDRVDLVQHFDPSTRDVVKSVADVNGDGVADLLVLFQEGEPVYTRWASLTTRSADASALHVASGPRSDDDSLLPLDDPFSSDLTIRTAQLLTPLPDFTPSTPVGTLEDGQEGRAIATVSRFAAASVNHHSADYAATFSPRAPPVREFFITA